MREDNGRYGQRRLVRVLEEDPELGLRVPADRVDRARRELLAPARNLAAGVWDAPVESSPGRLGFLILDGVLARDLLLAGRTCTELLGEGDVLQPGAYAREERLLRYHVRWHVLEPVRLAVLDESFARALGEWPQVTRSLLERVVRRTLRTSVHTALLQLSPAETRLLLLFWHLAERWGRVTKDGIVLRLPLSHQLLGELIGCRRASVTTALGNVASAGRVQRRDDGSWLLMGDPPGELSQLNWHEGVAAIA